MKVFGAVPALRSDLPPMTDRETLIYERILERMQAILERIPPIVPGPCYWLHDDATESFCRKHVIQARGREFDLGAPLVDPEWYDRDDWEDAFWEGVGASDGSESDLTEACARCGETLSYVLTDSGARDERAYWLESPLIQLRDEDTYALDRITMNVWPGAARRALVETAAVVNQAWRLL